MSGIYIHIPFCKHACHYCDFHFSTSLKYQKKLINSINKEIEIQKNYLKKTTVKSIYIGGGTPSVIESKEINSMLTNIKTHYQIDDNAEITIECNPDDITKNKLNDYKKNGINRISLGVQSFNDKHLIFSNRTHNSLQAIKSIELILEEKFKNFSIDLIYGFPNMTLEEWKENLEIFLKYKIPHLSAYCLTIEKKTVFNKYKKEGKIKELNQKKLINMFLYLIKKLEKNNYKQYEISNFSLKNHHSVHNSNYWKQKKYLGIGPSAHSYDKNNRQWNISNNIKYINSIEKNIIPFKIEKLSEENKLNEYLLTSIRTSNGVNKNFINKNFNSKLISLLKRKLKNIPREFIIENENNIKLTNRGKCFADKITRDLFY
tara:strand:+ start:933 stop:2054 length:1122 start_codon:yes stop_codon:yes gene_type:complete